MAPPFAHLLAGFTLGFRHRTELAGLLRSTPTDRSILGLNPAALKSDGIAALALDFDGVLAPHGASAPLPEAVIWMRGCADIFGEERMFVLSNKPTNERRVWFERNFPAVRFISGVRKKPYPDGIRRGGELAGIDPSAILMVDDRLLTGCLAALAAGASPCYIRRPYASFTLRPLAELFFALLRAAERGAVRVSSLF